MNNVNDIVERNLPLVKYMIKRMNLQDRFEDFVDIGWIALVDGAKKYNPDLNIKESTFLCQHIRFYFMNQLSYENKECRRTKDLDIRSLEYELEDDIFASLIPSKFDIESEFNIRFIITEIENTLKYDMKKHHVPIIMDMFEIGTDKLSTGQLVKKYGVSKVTINNIKHKFRNKLKERLKFILD